MKTTIKWLSTVLSIFLTGNILTHCLSSCHLIMEEPLKEYESEYFRYSKREKDGEKEGYIVGFTDLGAAQTALVLPQEIDGIPIVSIGYERRKGLYYIADGSWGGLSSDTLKRLYVLKTYHTKNSIGLLSEGYVVHCRDVYCDISAKGVIRNYIQYKTATENSNSWLYFNRSDLLANVSYMYNYEGAPDGGYYWVDSYDNTVIDFIPPEPTRDGYMFGGWYYEPDCLHPWNFETDITGNLLPIFPTSYALPEDIYSGTMEHPHRYEATDGTHLYAQWIEN